MQVVCKMDMLSIDKLIGNLRSMLERAVSEGGNELKQIADNIMLESTMIECPKETWTLANSGYVKEPVRTMDQISVELGYGGLADQLNPRTGKMASSYMVPVHERLDLRHPIGKAKFFEDPVRRAEQSLQEQLGNRIRVTLSIVPGR